MSIPTSAGGRRNLAARITVTSPTTGSYQGGFWSLAQARVVIGDWKDEYNHHRRHSALGYQTPASYAAACTHR
jgi:transposase InsO family protein